MNESIPVNEQLILAAIRGNNQKVNSLLAGGADVNALGRGKTTALMMAASEGYLNIVNNLLAAGCWRRCKHQK